MAEDYDVLKPDEVMAEQVMEEYGDELSRKTIGVDIGMDEIVAMIRETSDSGGA